MKQFLEIRKVDEEQQMVWGYATTEMVDCQGETVTKAAITAAWDDYMKFANIREMHQPSAVGIVKEYDLDAPDGVMIGAKIVDPVAWQKVVEGVYKGFSIGGKKLKDGFDALTKTITGMQLTEISLVDRPANPGALITMFKAADIDEDNAMSEASQTTEVAKTEETPVVAQVEDTTTKSETPPVIAEPSSADQLVAMIKSGEITADDLLSFAKAKAKKGDEAEDGDVAYADEANKKYPIDTEEHIKAAWSYINQKKNQKDYTADEVESIKDKIIAAWKKVIDKDGPPSAEEDTEKAVKSTGISKVFQQLLAMIGIQKAITADITKAAGHVEDIQKGLHQVSWFADLIQSLSYLQQECVFECEYEGDGSTVPAKIGAAVQVLGALLLEMAQEEISELKSNPALQGGDPFEILSGVILCADTAGDLKKAQSIMDLFKAGARNSTADQSLLQEAHDNLAKLGAACAMDDDAEKLAKALSGGDVHKHTTGDDLQKALGLVARQTETITKLNSTVDDLKTKVEDIQKLYDKTPKNDKQPQLRIIEKNGATTDVEVEPVLKADGSVDDLTTQMKKIHASGGRPVF